MQNQLNEVSKVITIILNKIGIDLILLNPAIPVIFYCIYFKHKIGASQFWNDVAYVMNIRVGNKNYYMGGPYIVFEAEYFWNG